MSDTTDLSAEQLANPKTFADPAHVRAIYRHHRENRPIAYVEPRGYRPFWLLTRYHDIRELERQSDIYEAAPRTVLLPVKVEDFYARAYGDPNGVKPLTHMDGDYHRLHRGVTLDWFGSKNLRTYADVIAGIAKEFVDRMEDMGGACDFSADIAYWYPLRVIMTLMGVPREDEPEVLRLTQRLFSPADKSFQTGSEKRAADSGPSDVVGDFATYFRVLTAERRRRPRNDIISTIANADLKGCPMGEHEMTCYYIIAATAGHDTTAASIGGGLSGLIDAPEQMDLLRGNLGLLTTASEEFIRWTAPVKHFMRTPNRDVEWHGQTIKAGEAIMLSYPSACFDEDVFPDAERFRVDRPLNPAHVAFGFGPHLCLGRNLANMEIRAFFRELIPRLRRIEGAGDRTFVESVFVSGLKQFPVHYSFAR